MNEPLLTPKEVAIRLGCKERHVQNELIRKNMRGAKLSIGWRISEADYAAYVDVHKNVSDVRRRAS